MAKNEVKLSREESEIISRMRDGEDLLFNIYSGCFLYKRVYHPVNVNAAVSLREKKILDQKWMAENGGVYTLTALGRSIPLD